MRALASNWWYNGKWDGWSDVILIVCSVIVLSIISVIAAEIRERRIRRKK